MRPSVHRLFSCALLLAWPAFSAPWSFDSDPGWEAQNSRPGPGDGRRTIQDFGYSDTRHTGGSPGEIGGTVTRTVRHASYSLPIPEKTLNDRLSASGAFTVTRSDGGGVLFGWFNDRSQGWRTPNSLVFRIDGESGKFRLLFEYGTQTWRTGGGACFEGPYQTTKTPMHLADGTVHTWTLDYDPAGAEGNGLITFVLDGTAYTAPLAEGHKEEGAVFNRFGLLNQMTSGGPVTAWFGNLAVEGLGGELERSQDWIGAGNRDTFTDLMVRPIHNFGFSPTGHAGGSPGEIGGVIWRIESMNPEQTGYYAAPTGPLTLRRELRASGKVALTAAAADSGVLIGWFNAETPHGAPPDNFVGAFIEGPSRAGHYFRPAWGNSESRRDMAGEGPVIRPDGAVRHWSIHYNPETGTVTTTLDGEAVTLTIPPEAVKGNAALNRFGILSFLRGGHYVEIYFDDMEFTAEQGG